jgi:hypothetical protein
MDEKTLRFQCLQHASSLMGAQTMPGQESKHSAEEVMIMADKLYTYCTTGKMPA